MRALFVSMFKVANTSLSRLALRRILTLYLVRATQFGLTRGVLACALMEGVRLGYADGMVINNFLPFRTFLAIELRQALDALGVLCAPRQQGYPRR
jgi:hypothetical protein